MKQKAWRLVGGAALVALSHLLGCEAPLPRSVEATAAAAETARNGRRCERVGEQWGGSGEWILALTWSQGFCAANPEKGDTDQCTHPSSFARQNLVLHGLWPQWDSYCYAEPRPAEECRSWDRLPAVPITDARVAARLREVMPGAGHGLDRHEWNKHGNCSGMSADAYFGLAESLVDAANATALAGVIRAHVGGVVSVAELCDAARRDFGEEGARAVSLEKTRAQGERTPVLTGLWIALVDSGGGPKLDAAHLGTQRSGCGGDEEGDVFVTR
jgi:ribonuclease T2